MATHKKVCEYCKKEFVTIHNGKKYCSEKCKQVANSIKRSEWYEKKKAEAKVSMNMTCPVCGTEFRKRGSSKYCSKACAYKAQKEQNKANRVRKKTGLSPLQNGTICWHCKWATGKDGHCPWARSLTPVAGWKAEKVKLKISIGDYTDSYIVKDCPLFEEG